MNKNEVVNELAQLISNLSSKGFIRAASIVTDILSNLVTSNEAQDKDYDPEVANLAKNIVGLTDNTVDNMNQGFSWEGFSSQYISTQ